MISDPRANDENGVFSDGLRIKQLPVARAGPALRPIVPMGPFQGTIPAVTPSGSFRTILRKPSSCGHDSPPNLSIKPALYLNVYGELVRVVPACIDKPHTSAHSPPSNPPNEAGEPIDTLVSRAISIAFSSIRSANFRRMLRR